MSVLHRLAYPALERMTIQRQEHVGIVVDDLAAATAFFVELGLKLDPGRPRTARADRLRARHARRAG
jgi:hypothetical protein